MWHTKSTAEVAKTLKTNIQKGLSDEEIKKRKEQYGINKLKEKRKSIYKIYKTIFIGLFRTCT